MASLLRTDSPGDLERSQVPIRTSFATMMRETSECRHRPREFVRSTHEESVKDVSVDLSGMSPRVHTLSPLRGARDLALRPSPRLRGEGGRRPDEGCVIRSAAKDLNRRGGDLRSFAVGACPERAQRVEWAAQDDTSHFVTASKSTLTENVIVFVLTCLAV